MFHHQPHRKLMWCGQSIDATKNCIGCLSILVSLHDASCMGAAVFLFSRDQPSGRILGELERGRRLSRPHSQSLSKSHQDRNSPRRDTTRGFYSRRVFARNTETG